MSGVTRTSNANKPWNQHALDQLSPLVDAEKQGPPALSRFYDLKSRVDPRIYGDADEQAIDRVGYLLSDGLRRSRALTC